MPTSVYIIGLFLSSVFSWGALAIIVTKLDPFFDGALAFALFFATLFFALAGTFTIIGFYLRMWWRRNEIYYQNINVSFRQGVLLSMASCGLLGLQGLRVLTWWDALLLAIAIILIEVIFLAKVNHDT